MKETDKTLTIIYNTVLRLLNTNCNIEKMEDLRRVLLIITNYHQLNEPKEILLMGLHLCKLDNWDSPYIAVKIDRCLQIATELL